MPDHTPIHLFLFSRSKQLNRTIQHQILYFLEFVYYFSILFLSKKNSKSNSTTYKICTFQYGYHVEWSELTVWILKTKIRIWSMWEHKNNSAFNPILIRYTVTYTTKLNHLLSEISLLKKVRSQYIVKWEFYKYKMSSNWKGNKLDEVVSL